uniref:4Fe-4S cluster-binding domain-containing protein n=1 Tax=candidate division WOR-3 bacterium TaxID=2052148 RepID=A0A7C4TC81_UNCW3
MSKGSKVDYNYKEEKGLIINIFVTGRCNARCKECINQIITDNSNLAPEFLEIDIKRDFSIIQDIIKKHNGLPATICFYGGEPLLEPEKFVPLIELLEQGGYNNSIKYMIYTNGEFLARFFKDYPDIAKKIWIYAVSIDGDEVQHNYYRSGTDLKRIKENLKYVKGNYKNILMWSTLREGQSLMKCFEEFLRLYNDSLVNHFFWHCLETQEDFKDFPAYFKSYTEDLKIIIDYYITQLKKGNLLPIAHINELLLYLITKKERNHTACGAELDTNYDLVGGHILACVDLPFDKGKELKQNPNDILRLKEALGCFKCNIHFYCGGRCPIQVIYGTSLRTRQYCDLLKAHVGIVESRLDEIKSILDEKKITLQDIYNRSAFIVRYTDVTP